MATNLKEIDSLGRKNREGRVCESSGSCAPPLAIFFSIEGEKERNK
jgi:hypothetical protein